ncbi:MAG: preprotein translocase subunit SecE [Planctomycetota bacterium]|nr:MAG: preprotein translocase subunit SecE [Planctomycetota bacterium]
MAYKREQGRYVRLASFWLIWGLIFYGCIDLRYSLESWGLPEFFSSTLAHLPVIQNVTPISLFAWIVLPLISMFVVLRILNKPKIADYLIETEVELRKVAWPSFKDTRSASIVVVVTVLILALFLTGADIVLNWGVHQLIFPR